MRPHLDLALTVGKDLQRPDLNEDAFVCGDGALRQAIADGASESFDSKTWANLLTEKFVREGPPNVDWVFDAVGKYNRKFDVHTLSWSKAAAFERGSFSSLLGVTFDPESELANVFGVGDSLCVHTLAGRVVASFPYTRPEQFDERPELLSTLKVANAFVAEPNFFDERSAVWRMTPDSVLLLMTDALGQWLLKELAETPSSLETLLKIHDYPSFELLVDELRKTHRLRLDDTTIVRLSVDSAVP